MINLKNEKNEKNEKKNIGFYPYVWLFDHSSNFRSWKVAWK